MDKLSKYSQTRDYSISTYNDEQKLAINVLISFIESKNGVHYTLEGPAGTGKTTIVKDVLKLATVYGKKCVSAPTHKAVRVVSKSSGLSGKTIHSLLGLKPNTDLENFNPNSPMFRANGNIAMSDYKVVVIDEASMINKYLYSKIIGTARRYNVKVIFIGDDCQTPPVKETISEVFTSDEQVSLTTIMRQDIDSKLLPILIALRRDIKLGSSYTLSKLKQVPTAVNTNGGYFVQTAHDFVIAMKSYFSEPAFEKNIDYVKMICRTNDAVKHWNHYIRTALFPTVTDVLCQDDLLMAYTTIVESLKGDKIMEIITNSEDYIVNDFNKYTNDIGLNGFLVSLRSVYNGDITPHMFVVDHNDTDSMNKYFAIVQRYISTAEQATNTTDRRLAWKDYSAYCSKNLCMVNLYRRDKTLLKRKDIDYGFAVTVHKSQGSTYGNVFVDATNICYNNYGTMLKDATFRNRLLYVALSRPTTNAFMHLRYVKS